LKQGDEIADVARAFNAAGNKRVGGVGGERDETENRDEDERDDKG